MRLAIILSLVLAAAAPAAVVENAALRVEVRPDGSLQLLEKSTGTAWELNPPEIAGVPVHPAGATIRSGGALRYATTEGFTFEARLEAAALDYTVSPPPGERELALIPRSLALGPGERNYYAVPHRLGILLPVTGAEPYSRRFRAYETGRGYSMAMFGAVRDGAALLASWTSPYTELAADYTPTPHPRLTASLFVRHGARAVRLEPLGRGGYVEIAKAYRRIARERGFLKTLAEKMRANPRVADFFGAADFKPFAFVRNVPNTRWNPTPAERLNVSFTFEECADLAEHYKKDLGIDRALLVVAGWVNGGYDNRHPDVLPAAPEIGGNEGLAACGRRVRALGWVFGLHDNYQDIYRNAPSWNERYVMRNRDGTLHQGGVWAGGLAYLICSRQGLELAARPQNVPGVMKLCSPNLYFSDTVFAAPPYECFDPAHPLTFDDDIRSKQQLCDYLRKQAGLFGSEEGREWGVAHADYFEGLLSHRTRFQRKDDRDIVIPLFELVFADAIPLYTHQSDRPRPDNPEFILHHILYAEMPVYYFGRHHYWTDPAQDFKPPAGSDARLVFARGGKFGLIDQFIKNTWEVLSPLNRLTSLMPMEDHRFLTADRQVELTRFGKDVEITVNYGTRDFERHGAVLPQYGFLVESPTYYACHIRSGAGTVLRVKRSVDGKALAESRNVYVYEPGGR